MTEYSFYGLRLRSTLQLSLLPQWDPDLVPNGAASEITVTLTTGEVPQNLEDLVWSSPFVSVARSGAALVTINAVGRFLIRGGNEIVVDAVAQVGAGELETFLVGLVAGIVLHQREILPLHASCVLIGDRAIALAGPSGLGKSTLAAALLNHGATLLTDDISAVSFCESQSVHVAHGAIGLRLWPDSRSALRIESQEWLPVRAGHRKVVSAVPAVARGPSRLHAVIRLRGGNYPGHSIHRLNGPPAVAPMTEVIYRARLGRALGQRQDLFLGLMRLADRVPIFELRRPLMLAHLQDSVDCVLSTAGETL